MSRSVVRRATAAVAVGAAVVAATGLAAGEANAAPSTDLAPGITTSQHTQSAAKITSKTSLPAGVPKKGSYAFLLKLDATPSLRTYDLQKAKGASTAGAKSAAKTQSAAIARAQDRVAADLPSKTTQIYRMHAAMAGLAVRTDVKNYAALTRIPGVSAVYPIAPKAPSNAYAVPLQGAPEAWKAYGDLGQNSTVAIIDTGVDYTHADFGGLGTVADFKAASAQLGKPVTPGEFPGDKVVGGYDLAGDAYNADPTDPATYQPTPSPDPYPLDCNSHGTHVAGTVGGYGVNADGSTYTGKYNKSTPFDSMRIGPGVAPEAKLYAFRVFGCVGSTDLVGAAIDRALDPNGDGDPSDHVDVVNMSLGGDFGSPNDGDSVVTNGAAAAGIVMAVASGNAGDIYDIGGSPGNAPRALTVAASVDAASTVDALNVSAPSAIAGKYAAERSVAYDYTTGADLSGTVAQVKQAGNTDGCSPLNDTDKAAVNGKIAFVEWTDVNARRCGSVGRSANLLAAGATGFIFGDDVEAFSAGITGSAAIPGVLAAKSGADAIRAQLVAGNTVTISSTTLNGFTQIDPSLNDTLTDFTSRGIGDDGNVKPDVTAVGASVFSAGSGTGNQGLNDSGTSMATPMVAGTAALVVSQHPNWTSEQTKADIMNTATTDLYTKTDHTGKKFAPNRVGSGRIDIKKAVDNDVVAYTSDGAADGTDNGAVSASFGPVEVTAGTTKTLTRTVTVQNLGNTARTYTTSFVNRTTLPGATYTVTPDTVTVDPRSKKTITLTLDLDASKLTKAIDSTMDATQASDFYDGATPRQFKADASGLVVLKSTGAPTLRVPAYAAPRPTSTTTQAASLTLPAGGVQTALLPITGQGINQGTGAATVQSLVAGFELQASSGKAPACSDTVTTLCVDPAVPETSAADLKYVGVTSNAPQLASTGDDVLTSDAGQAYFSITTQGPWRTAASQEEFDIYLDTTGDGKADYAVFNTRAPAGTDQTDVLVAETVNLKTGSIVDVEPLDAAFGDTDTALLNSDTMVLSVNPSLIGLTAGNSRITYSVQALSPFKIGDQTVDHVGTVAGDLTLSADSPSFDVANPGVAVYGSYDSDTNPLLYRDSSGSVLELRRDAVAYAEDKGQGALIVHFQNAVGDKAQVVALNKNASATSLTLAPNPVTVGSPVTATVSVSGLEGLPATGDVTVSTNGAVVGTGTLDATGSATITLPAQSAAGSFSYTATYAGDASYSGSTSTPVTLVVNKAASSTALTISPNPVTVNRTTTATVTVSGAVGEATGSVTLKSGSTTVGTATLTAGKATFAVKPTAVGTPSYTASYAGSDTYAASDSAATTLTVKAEAKPTVKLVLSRTTVKVGTKVTATITVTGASGTPTGKVPVVKLDQGGGTITTVTLVNGTGTGMITVGRTGTFTLQGQYAGDATYGAGNSASVKLVVTK